MIPIDYNTKARNWTAILYPENLIDNWQDNIARILQIPFCYIVHDKDLDQGGFLRKTHIHIIYSFPNTTTYKHALNTVLALGDPLKPSPVPNNVIEAVKNMRFMYDYLIHDTPDCKKALKHLYKPDERICGNSFDIGFLEQISQTDKELFLDELTRVVLLNDLTNFADLVKFVLVNYDAKYFSILRSNAGYFDKLIRGNYYKKKIDQNSPGTTT